MDITEIRIKLMNDPSDRLQAFCSLTFDHWFVIRDLKIIQGTKGSFVAMPSRKLTDRCSRCGGKNHLRARFCNECGARLQEERAIRADDGRAKLYADIAHPIHCDCRDLIQRQVVEAYHAELERSKLPGYVCMYDDFGEESFAAMGDDQPNMLEMPQVLAAPAVGSYRRREMGTFGSSGHLPPAGVLSREPARLKASSRGEGEDDGFGAGII